MKVSRKAWFEYLRVRHEFHEVVRTPNATDTEMFHARNELFVLHCDIFYPPGGKECNDLDYVVVYHPLGWAWERKHGYTLQMQPIINSALDRVL